MTTPLKPVLILSYFFPPCNLTAAQRAQGWARYLHKFGYYPIIITRNWDTPIETPEDVLKASGNKINHVKTSHYEVYFLPYKPSLRDRLFVAFKTYPLLRKCTKLLTFFTLVCENFTTRLIAHRNIYVFALQYLKENPEVKQLLITGNPFDLFHFGYLLHLKTGIQWFADYRDDWNTSELKHAKTPTYKALRILSAKSEKKWVGSARAVFSVSDGYIKKISGFTGIPGHLLLNGYETHSTEHSKRAKTPKKEFIITYNGSLYQTQPIEAFLEVIETLNTNTSTPFPVRLCFPGLAFDSQQEKRVLEHTRKYKHLVTITPRIPRNEVLQIQENSDLLVLFAHSGIKGIPSSKLYEYIGLKKPILFFPNDYDIIEQTLNETGLGIICDTKKELYSTMLELLHKKYIGEPFVKPKNEQITAFSRVAQTEKLAEILKRYQ